MFVLGESEVLGLARLSPMGLCFRVLFVMMSFFPFYGGSYDVCKMWNVVMAIFFVGRTESVAEILLPGQSRLVPVCKKEGGVQYAI